MDQKEIFGEGTFTSKSVKLNLNFQVHVLNETKSSNQKCYVMTIHDLGSNRKLFKFKYF